MSNYSFEDGKPDTSNLTEQVLHVRHQVIEVDEDGKPKVTKFILITNKHHLHLTYNHSTEEASDMEMYPSREISKFELPQIYLMNHEMQVPLEDGGDLIPIMHYFFLDNRNEVQLVYPDYKSKSQKYEIID